MNLPLELYVVYLVLSSFTTFMNQILYWLPEHLPAFRMRFSRNDVVQSDMT